VVENFQSVDSACLRDEMTLGELCDNKATVPVPSGDLMRLFVPKAEDHV